MLTLELRNHQAREGVPGIIKECAGIELLNQRNQREGEQEVEGRAVKTQERRQRHQINQQQIQSRHPERP